MGIIESCCLRKPNSKENKIKVKRKIIIFFLIKKTQQKDKWRKSDINNRKENIVKLKKNFFSSLLANEKFEIKENDK